MVLSATIGAIGAAGTLAKGIGALGSMFSHGGGTDISASKELARYNMNLNKQYTQWLNENNYSFMRKGLEKADYNPMLALGASPQQGSLAPSTAVEGNQVNPLNAVSALNTAANTRLQEQQAETEIAKRENLKADTGMKLVDKLYKEGLIKWQDRQNYADLVLKNTTSQMNSANAKASIANAYSNRINANTARYESKYGTPHKSIISLFERGRGNPYFSD